MRLTAEPAYPPADAALRAEARRLRDAMPPDELRRLVEALPGPRNRRYARDAMAATDRLLTEAWTAAGWTVERQELALGGAHAGLRGTNLIAVAPGATSEAVVVIAHHDTVPAAPGADDNGAGLAVLMAAARALGVRPRHRTVILAAPDFEEIGLLGSRELVPWLRRRWRPRATVVFDPIGYMSSEPGSQRVPGGIGLLYPRQVARVAERDHRGDTVVCIYRRSSLAHVRIFASCLAAAVGEERVILLRDPADLPLIGPALLALPVVRNFARSDHWRFWRAGLPAILVTNTANFRNPHYHAPSDRPETLDYDTLSGVAAATVLAVERLAAPP